MSGCLIAVEGIDGSGLTTHSRLLARRLSEIGLAAVYTKEPTEGPAGQVIRQLLALGGTDPWTMALLFAADRIWHMTSDPSLPGGAGVERALELGYIVVSDRYKYSSIAYQGALGAESAWLWEINARAKEANIIVYIDVPVEVSIRRLMMRDKKEAYENAAVLTKVKEMFEQVLAEAARKGSSVIRVMGVRGTVERSVDEVNAEIVRKVLEVLR